MSSPRYVLAVLAQGFEEIEAVTPIDLLRRAGVSVTIASLDERLEVVGKNGMTLLADAPLDVSCARAYDMILLPGGPGVRNLRADPRVADLVKSQAKRGGWVAAICAAHGASRRGPSRRAPLHRTPVGRRRARADGRG